MICISFERICFTDHHGGVKNEIGPLYVMKMNVLTPRLYRKNGPIKDPPLNPFPDPSYNRKLHENIRHEILGDGMAVNGQFDNVFVT